MYSELKHKFEFYDNKKALEIEMGQTESAGEKETINQSETDKPVLTSRKIFKFYF